MKKGFTILEMMIVLSIVALLFLLTLPNIQQKQGVIQDKGCEALVEVVNAQILLYQIENENSTPDMGALISGGYIKQSQSVCPSGSAITISNGEAHAN